MFHRSSKRYFTLSLATFIPPCAHCEKGDSTNIEVNDFALHSSIKHKQKDLKVNEIFSSQHIVDARSEVNSFIVQYDFKTRNPKYVIEHFRKSDSDDNRTQKRPNFFGDASISIDSFRVTPHDYKENNAIFDRGHMVPAADFPTGSQKSATFNMANIAPQLSELNRGFWAKFEAWTRSLLDRGFEEVWVITGPVFAPIFVNGQWLFVHPTIGHFPRLIQVPSHFFKVIVTAKSGENASSPVEYGIGAFLVPNQPVTDKENNLEDYLVRLDQLEAIVGFNITAILSKEARSQIDSFVSRNRELETVLKASSAVPSTALQLPSPGNETNLVTTYQKPQLPPRKQQIQHLCTLANCRRMFKEKKSVN